MSLAFPAAVFLLALVLTYRSSGVWRLAATAGMLAAVTWSISLILDPVSGLALIAGPLLAALLIRRPPRVALDFEALSRRAIGIVVAVVAAIFAATKFPVAENAVALTSVPWLLAAVGAAWMVRPLDREERVQGLVLLIAAGAALLTVAIPRGPVTAGAAGALAVMPVVARRWAVPAGLGPTLRAVLIGGAAVCAAVAVSPAPLPRLGLGDLAIGFDGIVLVGAATLLLAAVLVAQRVGWAVIPGIASLVGTAPAVRWAGLAALVAVLTVDDPQGERPSWVALGLLGVSPLFTALVVQPWSARAAAVLLAAGLVVITASIRRLAWGGLALAATTFLVILAMRGMTTTSVARLQWVAAIGAVMVLARPLILRGPPATGERVREALLAGLLLLAVSSRDALGLGLLAAVLLVITLSLVLSWPPSPHSNGVSWFGRLELLARSNWPPGISVAAGALTVTAALQASLALGLFAAVLFAVLQLAPFLDPPVPTASARRALIDWLSPAVSLACGVAPALVLRMLRL